MWAVALGNYGKIVTVGTAEAWSRQYAPANAEERLGRWTMNACRTLRIPGNCAGVAILPGYIDCGEKTHMWRSLFLAIGATVCMLGAECLVVDDFILANRGAPNSGDAAKVSRDIKPPEWAPWSLLSAGAVTMLYSFTIPQRVKH